MNLAGFRLYRYSLPLTAPLALGGETLGRREGVLLKVVVDSGAEGWGEAAPLPGFSREGVEGVAGELHDLFSGRPDLEVTADWALPRTEADAGPEVRGLSPSARFAYELAVLDLLADAGEGPLPRLLAPRPRAAVPVNALLSGPRDRVLEDAVRLRGAGYRAFKLKVGSGGATVGEDADLARSLREALGDGATLRLDANRAWSLAEAAEFVRGAAGVGFEYLEEPLSDPGLLAGFVGETGTPVALDESLAGMDPDGLEAHRYARAVVLKPTLLGGLSRTTRFAEAALALGMTPVVSSAYETGVGTAALVALAAAVGDRAVPAGLDTYRRLAADVVRPAPDLASPEVDVAGLFGARRGVDHRFLVAASAPADAR